MGIKLYPPRIEEVICAQSGTEIHIPFQLSKTVSLSNVKKIVARLKTVSTTLWLGNISTIVTKDNVIKKDNNWYEVIFDLNNDTTYENLSDKDSILKMKKNITKIGAYYKVQLSCVNESNELGYFSNISVYKYSAKPTLSVSEESYMEQYIGLYSQEGKDPTEKIYSYQFDLLNTNGEIFESSGEIIHNSEKDNSIDSSQDLWNVNKNILNDLGGTIRYSITTVNGIKSSIEQSLVPCQVGPSYKDKINIAISNNYDNGYIKLKIQDLDNIFIDENTICQIYRSEDSDNFTYFYKIGYCSKNDFIDKIYNFFDFSVVQGITYQYLIKIIKYNNEGKILSVSEGPLSLKTMCDYEDIFLFDGKRQLKVKYNPTINNFKINVSEQRVNTLGSKFPFIVKNGNVYYKDFSISGLISYLADNDNLFINNNGNFSTDLTSINIKNERIFREFVLNWLNNGQPKLFKSPTEGNSIVRIMNVSLSPVQNLGRMLYTFSANAYEIDDYSIEKLLQYNFIKKDESK